MHHILLSIIIGIFSTILIEFITKKLSFKKFNKEDFNFNSRIFLLMIVTNNHHKPIKARLNVNSKINDVGQTIYKYNLYSIDRQNDEINIDDVIYYKIIK